MLKYSKYRLRKLITKFCQDKILRSNAKNHKTYLEFFIPTHVIYICQLIIDKPIYKKVYRCKILTNHMPKVCKYKKFRINFEIT